MLSITCTKESGFYCSSPAIFIYTYWSSAIHIIRAGEFKSRLLFKTLKSLHTNLLVVQVISETWPPGHFGYFFALEKVPRRPGAKARLT